MKVHVYEKAWMAISVVLLVAFAGSVLFMTVAHGIHPPSRVETIDPTAVLSDPRFANLGVQKGGEGIDVVLVAQIWSFLPGEIRVPVGTPVTFRITSPDVVHGFQVVGTNVNAMVIPGYVTQVTTTFQKPAEHLLLCNEYCGVGHHLMMGKVIVEAAP